MNFLRAYFLVPFYYFLRKQYDRYIQMDIFHKRLTIINDGYLNIEKRIMQGCNNKLVVGKHSRLNKVKIQINGSNNSIIIGEKCFIGPNSKLLLEGNNMKVEIGDGVRFTHDDELTCQEDNSEIIIGNKCRFSHHINIRTSDSHEIIDLESNERINPPKSVHIGEHVWLAPEVIILKGVSIGDGAIVGTRSVVTKNVPSYTLAVGMPAKVVKENVTRRETKLF